MTYSLQLSYVGTIFQGIIRLADFDQFCFSGDVLRITPRCTPEHDIDLLGLLITPQISLRMRSQRHYFLDRTCAQASPVNSGNVLLTLFGVPWGFQRSFLSIHY